MPPVTRLISSSIILVTLDRASRNAASTRSSRRSASSALTTAGSMAIAVTSWAPFMVTFTLPPPAVPTSSLVFSSSWTWVTLAWRAWAFFSIGWIFTRVLSLKRPLRRPGPGSPRRRSPRCAARSTAPPARRVRAARSRRRRRRPERGPPAPGRARPRRGARGGGADGRPPPPGGRLRGARLRGGGIRGAAPRPPPRPPRGRRWRRSPAQPRLQRIQPVEQIVDGPRRRQRAQLQQGDLEERPRGLRAAERSAGLQHQGEHRGQIVGVEFRGLGGVALTVGGRRVDQLLKGAVHRDQHELAEVMGQPVRDLLHVHAAVVQSVQRLQRPLGAARGDRLAQVEEGV